MSLSKLKKFVASYGFYIYLATITISFVQLLLQSSSGHFDIFRSSAQLLWQAKNPYGILYPSAYFLYSPFCGMSIFGIFAWLPYKVDLALFMATSLFLFTLGCEKLLRVLQMPRGSFLNGLFYALVSSELIGAILSAKLEIVQAGLLVLLCIEICKGKHPLLASFFLGAISAWKFQTLPPAGLLFAGLFIREQKFLTPLVFLLGLGLAFAFPLVIFDLKMLEEMHSDWQTTLHNFMALDANWLGFQHLHQSLRGLFGYSISLDDALILNMIIGGLLAAILIILGLRRNLQKKEILIYALSAGTGYVCAFSPLSQSGAYLLYFPLLASVIFLISKLETQKLKNIANSVLALSFYMISVAYSDLTPKALRSFFKTFSLKAIGILLLSALFAYLYLKLRKKHKTLFEPHA